MVSETSLSSFTRPPTPKFCNSFANRIFSDVAGDITVVVDGDSFLLHKFPLAARSGKIRRMVADAKDSNLSKLELLNFPGGIQTFELAAKFCYNMNFEITNANVAHLRCAAEYLEMSEDYREENLISCTEAYLNEVVLLSLENSLEVLSACDSDSDTLLPMVETVGIPNRCVDAIAINACKEQLVIGLSRLDCGSSELMRGGRCMDWWVQDLSLLKINFYQRVVSAMGRTGVRPDSIIASLMHYAQVWLKGIGKNQIWVNPGKTNRRSINHGTLENGQKAIVETLVSLLLLPREKSSSIPLSFLFGVLRMAIMVDATFDCRLELERRIAFRLDMVSLDDLLIPSVVQSGGDSLFDVDTVHRMLVHFLQRIEVEEEDEEEEENEDCGTGGYEEYSEEGLGFPGPGHSSLLKVGRLIDAYLAEIAADPYLSVQKFVAMVEVLPDYTRVIDDGLYRAVDIYIKAHSMLTEQECNKLCKFIDCQKLSQEACNHAVQNDRLPVQMTVRVLYFEQLRLKNAMCGDLLMSSQKMSSSGIPTSAAMSPRDNYASLRRENRELKLEISRMRVRLSDLEKEQVFMKQGMMEKSRNGGKTFLTSLSRGIVGRIGIFTTNTNNSNSSGPDGVRKQHHKSGKKKSRVSQGKTTGGSRSRRYSVS